MIRDTLRRTTISPTSITTPATCNSPSFITKQQPGSSPDFLSSTSIFRSSITSLGTSMLRRRRWRRAKRSEEHTSELQSPCNLVCRLLLEKKKREENYSKIKRQ